LDFRFDFADARLTRQLLRQYGARARLWRRNARVDARRKGIARFLCMPLA
jgi:hypothetical protein